MLTGRRTFVLALPAIAVLASRMPRAKLTFQDFGTRSTIPMHGMEAIGFGACEGCGAPAVHLSRDVRRIEPVDGNEAYEAGALHRGCAAHRDLAIDESKGV